MIEALLDQREHFSFARLPFDQRILALICVYCWVGQLLDEFYFSCADAMNLLLQLRNQTFKRNVLFDFIGVHFIECFVFLHILIQFLIPCFVEKGLVFETQPQIELHC